VIKQTDRHLVMTIWTIFEQATSVAYRADSRLVHVFHDFQEQIKGAYGKSSRYQFEFVQIYRAKSALNSAQGRLGYSHAVAIGMYRGHFHFSERQTALFSHAPQYIAGCHILVEFHWRASTVEN
jgi:hypothetical protein